MTDLVLTTYDWVPEPPRGFVRDLRVRWALEEAGLPYRVASVPFEGRGPDHFAHQPFGQVPWLTDGELSIFESGAILQYLGAKSGRFYPTDVRARAEVDQWLFWQVGGLGPMAGQTHHFRHYAPALIKDQRQIAYGVRRYTDETNRLYGVLDRRLSDREYLAGDYSIADMAAWPWILPEPQGQDLADFPNLKAWVERVGARPAVQKGRALGEELRNNLAGSGKAAEEARKLLFGQRARKS